MRPTRLTVALVAAGLLAACGGGTGSGGTGGTPPPVTAFVPTSVDDALDHAVSAGVDGIWVYLDSGGSTTLKAAGLEDRGAQAPARPATLFKIASISKMFVAVSSVRLVQAGTLRLDDSLAFWLPTLAGRIANADAVTLRHLLQHRSGIPDFDSEPGFSWRQSHTDLDALLGLVLDKPADFSPGARYAYSNTNYLLLGRVLDAALGYSHRDYVQNEILTPLAMNDTWATMNATNQALLARGYWDGIDRTTQDYTVPGGSMVSSARDVGVFIRALATGTLLDSDAQQIYASLFDGYGHSGWLPGYQSMARYHPGSDAVLVQFVNSTGGRSEQIAQETYDGLVVWLSRN